MNNRNSSLEGGRHPYIDMSDKILLRTILAFTLALVIVLTVMLSWIYFYDHIEPYLDIVDHNPTISGLTLIVLGALGINYFHDRR